MDDAVFEHRFWLQILGDHSRFILNALSPKETDDIRNAEAFITLFDLLLTEARRPDVVSQLGRLNPEAMNSVAGLKAFKLNLLERLLLGKVTIGFTPTFLSHMVNELEEYERILKALLAEKPVPVFHPLHHDMLWLQDAVGHAASIAMDLDLTENRLIEKNMDFQKHFEALYFKAVEMAGYMRTQLKDFPAFRKYHRDINLEMRVFMHFLQELEEMELKEEVLDRIAPLIPDHMFREECYYLMKLAQLGMVPAPDCDPAKPRVEG
jgi:hypothetical protein